MLSVAGLVLLALIVIGASAEAVVGFAQRRGVRPTGELVSAGSYRLHVDCRGTGSPTVVFESGYGGTSLDWALVQPDIARTNRTCSYDRAGYGWSDAAPTHTLDRMRRDFDVVIRAAGPGPYVLVAHSFGGLLAFDYASRHPQNVAGLVLVDAAYKSLYEKMKATYPQFLHNGDKLAVVTQAAAVLTRFGVTRAINQPASPKTVAPSVKRQYRVVGYTPKAYRAYADDLRAFRGYVDEAQDDPPSVPTAVLCHDLPGTLWQGVPKEAEDLWQAEQIALAHRMHTTVRKIEGTTHFIQVLRPDAVIAAIRDVVGAARGIDGR